jgi:hypothetical protein
MKSEQITKRLSALASLEDGWQWGKGSAANFDVRAAEVLCRLFRSVDALHLRSDGALIVTARARREFIEITMIGEDPVAIEKKSIM